MLYRLLHLSAQPLGNIPVRNVVYLVRAEVANAQQIAAQVKHLNRSEPLCWLGSIDLHESHGRMLAIC